MVCAHRSCALFVSAPDFTPLRVMRRVMRQRLLCLAEHRGTLRTLGWLPAVVGALFPSSAPVRTAPTMGCFSSKDVSPEPEQEEVSWDGTIRPIRPWKLEPSLTSAQLERLRNEFWETRVEGRQEMWQALRFAAEADSEELCNETVKAAGLRPANRRNTLQSMFDERGALYEVPMYALSAPMNLDVEPTNPEFKDAARAVSDYIDAHDRRNRLTRPS